MYAVGSRRGASSKGVFVRVVLFVCSVAPAMALTTENQLRAVFNNGEPTSTTMFCTSIDEIEILKAISTQRFLRADENSDTNEESDNHQRRKLLFYPASCKTACAGFATGTCTVVGCKGFRRDLNEKQQEGETTKMDEDARALQTSQDWCTKATRQANSYLDAAMNSGKVSAPCIKLINPTKRRIECLLVSC